MDEQQPIFVSIHGALTGYSRQLFMGLYGKDPRGSFFGLLGAETTGDGATPGKLEIDTQPPGQAVDTTTIKVRFFAVPDNARHHVVQGVTSQERRRQLLGLRHADIKIEPPVIRPDWARRRDR